MFKLIDQVKRKMQNIDSYDRGIHTSGQAARRLRRCCSVFGVRVGYRTLSGFETGVVFVSALQINDMILNALAEKPFDLTQLAIISFLIILSIIFSYSKEQFVAEYNEQLNIMESSGSRSSFAHSLHQ